MMRYKVDSSFTFTKSPEYQQWFDVQNLKVQRQIAVRLAHIAVDGYFGNYKELDDEISELKWLNGRRIYYAYIEELNIILLLGGNKNGQSKDITQAKKIFFRYKKSKKD